MDRICRIWEIELQTVIEIHKIGHRKRMLHSVGLPICKKEEKKSQIYVQDSNASGDSKGAINNKDEIVTKPLEQVNHTNGHKMNHGKNRSVTRSIIVKSQAIRSIFFHFFRPAPQPPNLSNNLEIRAPSELLLGVPTGLKTQWRHTANKLVSSSVRYENVNVILNTFLVWVPHFTNSKMLLQYLGSTLVKELRGTESTRKSIQKLKRGERLPPTFSEHVNTSQDSHRPIILSISHRGVQFFETNTQVMISKLFYCQTKIRFQFTKNSL